MVLDIWFEKNHLFSGSRKVADQKKVGLYCKFTLFSGSRKVVVQTQIFFWFEKSDGPEKKIWVWRTTFLGPLFYNPFLELLFYIFLENWLQIKWLRDWLRVNWEEKPRIKNWLFYIMNSRRVVSENFNEEFWTNFGSFSSNQIKRFNQEEFKHYIRIILDNFTAVCSSDKIPIGQVVFFGVFLLFRSKFLWRNRSSSRIPVGILTGIPLTKTASFA